MTDRTSMEWRGEVGLTRIEARQVLRDETICDAVVLVKDGWDAQGCEFSNNVFVCETEELAREFLEQITRFGEVSSSRVTVGDMSTAILVLAAAHSGTWE